MHKKILLLGLILGVIGLVFLSGCMHVMPLVVTPISTIVEGGGTVTFAAADSLGSPVSVTWSVSGLGTISTTGVYTAPSTVSAVTNATITATQVGYTGVTASATVTIEPPAEADLVDAVGDASAWIGTAYDVKSITTSLTSTALTVNIEFTAAPTLPPTSGTVAILLQLAGFLCFDTDENPATGWPSPNSLLCPSCPISGVSAIGVDYFVDLFSRNATGYPIRSTASPATPVGRATPSLAGNILTLTIPLTALGGDDGITGMNALLGNGWGPTDCVPDSVAAIVTGKDITPSSGNFYLDFLYDTYGISWGTSIAVTKTASPTAVQSGGTVAFTINVKNTGATSVILIELTNDLPSGEAVQTTSCTLPQTIEVGDTYTCTFDAVVTGSVGATKTDTVTATATDVYGAEVTASDTATVTIITP